MPYELGIRPVTAEEARAGSLARAADIKREREESVRGQLWKKIQAAAFLDGRRLMEVCFEKDECAFVRDVLVAEVTAQGFTVEWNEPTAMITVRW